MTLDGYRYTFNGRGDFWLAQTLGSSFSFQGRMVPALDTNGQPVAATVFSVLVAQQSTSDTVQLEVVSDQLVALINGVPVDFSILPVQQFSNVSLIDNGGNRITVVFSNGVTIEATADNGFIASTFVSFPNTLRGLVQGLLGVFNGDQSDDLTPQGGGPPIALNSTLQTIHNEFGITCKYMYFALLFSMLIGCDFVTGIIDNAAESLITNRGGAGFADFFDPNFVPLFDTSFSDPELEQNATLLCSGDQQCLFDAAATGRLGVGLGTLNATTRLNTINNITVPSKRTHHRFSAYIFIGSIFTMYMHVLLYEVKLHMHAEQHIL